MTFKQEIEIAAPPERVWAFLWDVERVARCLPGTREVRTVVPHERYEATVADRVGPFKVQFPLEIRVVAAEPPTRLKAEASGRDAAMGSALSVTLDLRIARHGSGSRLAVHSDVSITGRLAVFGQGIVQPKAEGIMARFAEAVRRELRAETEAC